MFYKTVYFSNVFEKYSFWQNTLKHHLFSVILDLYSIYSIHWHMSNTSMNT